jgi:hypothetical protein
MLKSPHDLSLLCGFVCIMLLHGFVLAMLVSSILEISC